MTLIENCKDLYVLVVEDDPLGQMIMCRLLDDMHIANSACKNGKEALQFVQDNNCSLIFMDFQMPEMDGVSATRAIRESGLSSAELPIIGLSAHAADESITEALEAGMNYYIIKPINKEHIRQTIFEYVH